MRIHEQMLAMHIQHQEVRQREKEIMMQVMMNSMLGINTAEQEEQRLIQRAIEESKKDCEDPNNPNVENMTYEQLLELEEKSGKVSKGLTPAQIKTIPEKIWISKTDAEEESCSICFENFERR